MASTTLLIIGGAIIGLIVVIFIVFLIWYLKTRRIRKNVPSDRLSELNRDDYKRDQMIVRKSVRSDGITAVDKMPTHSHYAEYQLNGMEENNAHKENNKKTISELKEELAGEERKLRRLTREVEERKRAFEGDSVYSGISGDTERPDEIPLRDHSQSLEDRTGYSRPRKRFRWSPI